MQISVTFKNIDPSENLKSHIKSKLDRYDKYLDNPAEANVVLSVEKFRHIAEINLTGDRLKINCKEETNDMYSAIDMVMDKLEIQIKRNKEKTRGHRGGSKTKVAEMLAEKVQTADDEVPRQVKIKNIEYKPMDVEEAVMQMDLSHDNFLVFTNAKTDQINVLYNRKDGHYGLIQPRN